MLRVALLAPIAFVAACATPREPAAPWPAAEALFHREPRWRGADAAYSIDLGGDRTLWLFGDTFVVPRGAANERRGSRMVRNTAALQIGRDPSTARMTFVWNDTGARPASWIAEDGDTWFWPLHGVRIDDAVTLFGTRVVATGEGGAFGFRAIGWSAFRVRGIDGPPDSWTIARLRTPGTPGLVVGNGVLRRGEFVYAFAMREPGDHALSVLRWPIASFARGELLAPEWWDGVGYRTNATPSTVLAAGAPEFTIVARDDVLLLGQSLGFPAGDLAVRTATAPEGPWSEPVVVFTPPEARRDSVLVYAAKLHAHFAGDALCFTYATNSTDFARLVGDETLYFPRCVRWTPPASAAGAGR